MAPDPSLKRSANGRPPGPVWRYARHFHQPVALVYFNSVVWHTSLALAFSQKAVRRAYLRHFARLPKCQGLSSAPSACG